MFARKVTDQRGETKHLNLPSGFRARNGLKPDIATGTTQLSQQMGEKVGEEERSRIPALFYPHPSPKLSGGPERLQSRIQFISNGRLLGRIRISGVKIGKRSWEIEWNDSVA